MNKPGYKLNRTEPYINNHGDARIIWETVDGVRHGYYKVFYDNGSVFRNVTYKNGVRCGLCELYHKDGEPSIKGFVSEIGAFEGESIDFNYGDEKLKEMMAAVTNQDLFADAFSENDEEIKAL